MIEMDFLGLVRMYHTQALVYLGKVKNPFTDEFEPNFKQAQLLIDILSVLEEKTVGNLNDQELGLLTESLKFLRANIQGGE